MPDVLKMLSDRVLVQRSQAPTQTEGGLHLPSVAGKKPNQGTVLAVGPGKVGPDGKLLPMTVTVGDEVLFLASGAQDVGDDRLVMSEADVLGILA